VLLSAVAHSHGFHFTAEFWSAIAAGAASFAAILLAFITHRQLAVMRAQLGEKGSVKLYPARKTYDPRERNQANQVTWLRDLPGIDPKSVRVVGLHLRNVGPFDHKVELDDTEAKVGENPGTKMLAQPAWGRTCDDRSHGTHDWLIAPARKITNIVIYLIGEWNDETTTRLRLDVAVGGDERVRFNSDVILWPYLENPCSAM
jgi:hypothetical protein